MIWRHRVWVAMGQLFLDTDLRPLYAHIAEELAQSPFTLEELRTILHDEVRPALAANLWSVAGEWAGFDDAWLIARIESRRFDPLARLVRMDDEWAEIAARVAALREGEPRH